MSMRRKDQVVGGAKFREEARRLATTEGEDRGKNPIVKKCCVHSVPSPRHQIT